VVQSHDLPGRIEERQFDKSALKFDAQSLRLAAARFESIADMTPLNRNSALTPKLTLADDKRTSALG
jgi:hypothetical protein